MILKMSKIRLKKQILFRVLFIILFFLMIYLLVGEKINYHNFLCKFKKNSDKDYCYLQESEYNDEFKMCHYIDSKFLKDYCYLKHKKCDFISNQYYNYMCQRMQIRPHIWSFIIKPRNVNDSRLFSLNECDLLNKYDRLHCIYSEAINEQKKQNNFSLCNIFNDTFLRGECKFYVQISKISKLNTNPQERISTFMSECNNISNPSWKSECYFLLADELSWNNDYLNYLNEIDLACKNSKENFDYFCTSHVLSYLSQNEILDFCENISSDKNQCYEAYGFRVATDISKEDPKLIINKCTALVNDKATHCIIGSIINIGLVKNVERPSYLLNYCNILPNEYKSRCYKEYGINYEFYMPKDLNFHQINEYCLLVPLNYIVDCYSGFGLNLDIKTESSIVHSVESCMKIKQSYQDICFSSLVNQFIQFSKKDSQNDLTSCDLFPERFRSLCKNELLLEINT